MEDRARRIAALSSAPMTKRVYEIVTNREAMSKEKVRTFSDGQSSQCLSDKFRGQLGKMERLFAFAEQNTKTWAIIHLTVDGVRVKI